jgi:hypothetical protein
MVAGFAVTSASAYASTVKTVSSHPPAVAVIHATTHAPESQRIRPFGTNGQQVYIYNGASTAVTICGTNQNNNYVCGSASTARNAYNYFPNWWWKYTITIYGNDGWTLRCNVPVSQSGNWTYCGYLP